MRDMIDFFSMKDTEGKDVNLNPLLMHPVRETGIGTCIIAFYRPMRNTSTEEVMYKRTLYEVVGTREQVREEIDRAIQADEDLYGDYFREAKTRGLTIK